MSTLKESFKGSHDIGQKLSRVRDYTPFFVLFLAFLVEDPSVGFVTLGCIFILLGLLIRIYAMAFFAQASPDSDSGEFSRFLVTEGAYSYVRNPVYVGTFFMLSGFCIFSSVTWLMLLGTLYFACQYYFISKYEEVLLEERFGEEYLNYRMNVPSWIPKEVPKLDDVVWPSSFSDGIRREKKTLFYIGLALLFMVIGA